MLYIPYSLKRCTKCGEWKLDSAKCFFVWKKGRSLLVSRCKPCNRIATVESKEYSQIRRAKPQHKSAMLYMPQSMKRCIWCDEWKLNSVAFFDRNNGGGPLVTICKACLSKYKKTYRETNKDRIAEWNRQYMAANRERRAAYRRQYKAANRDSIRQKNQEYYRANLDRIRAHNRANVNQIREWSRRWRQANKLRHSTYKWQYWLANKERIREWWHRFKEEQPEKYGAMIRAAYNKRKARKIAAGGKHTAADILNQYSVQEGRCYYCQKEVGLLYHVDHYIPLSKGGSNGPENLVIACPTCNMRKRNKLPDDFLELLRTEKDKDSTS